VRGGITYHRQESPDKVQKNVTGGRKITACFLPILSGILPAMSRVLILIVSLVWASLLLVSWGSTAETSTTTTDSAVVLHGGY